METIRTFKFLTIAMVMAITASSAVEAAGKKEPKKSVPAKAPAKAPAKSAAFTGSPFKIGSSSSSSLSTTPRVFDMTPGSAPREGKEEAAVAAAAASPAWQAPVPVVIIPREDAEAKTAAARATAAAAKQQAAALTTGSSTAARLMALGLKMSSIYGAHKIEGAEKLRLPLLLFWMLYKTTYNTTLKTQTAESIKALIAQLPFDDLGYLQKNQNGTPIMVVYQGRTAQLCTPVKEAFDAMVDNKEYINLPAMIDACKKAKRPNMAANNMPEQQIKEMESLCDDVINALTRSEIFNGAVTDQGFSTLARRSAIQTFLLSAIGSKISTGSYTDTFKGFGGMAKVGGLVAAGTAASMAYHNNWLKAPSSKQALGGVAATLGGLALYKKVLPRSLVVSSLAVLAAGATHSQWTPVLQGIWNGLKLPDMPQLNVTQRLEVLSSVLGGALKRVIEEL